MGSQEREGQREKQRSSSEYVRQSVMSVYRNGQYEAVGWHRQGSRTGPAYHWNGRTSLHGYRMAWNCSKSEKACAAYAPKSVEFGRMSSEEDRRQSARCGGETALVPSDETTPVTVRVGVLSPSVTVKVECARLQIAVAGMFYRRRARRIVKVSSRRCFLVVFFV